MAAATSTPPDDECASYLMTAMINDTVRSDSGPAYLSPGAREELRLRITSRRPIINITPTPALVDVYGELEWLTPEILIDRMVRIGQPSLVRSAGITSGAGGHQKSPTELLDDYTTKDRPIEVADAQRIVPALATLVGLLSVEFGAIARQGSCSLYLFPAGEHWVFCDSAEDLFLIPFGAAVRVSLPDAGLDNCTDSRAMTYVPGSSGFSINTKASVTLALCRFKRTSVAEFVIDNLKALLVSEPQWTQELSAVYGDVDKLHVVMDNLPRVLNDLRQRVVHLRWHDSSLEKDPQARDDDHARGVKPVVSQEPPVNHALRGNSYSCWNLTTGFKHRTDDIIIATYPRSGTTLMQMILFQLLTDGDLDSIEHMYQFSPYVSLELGWLGDSRIEALPSPRALKTHAPASTIYRSNRGKYICVVRNGLDVVTSYYYHQSDMNIGRLGFDAFFDRFMTGRGVYPEGTWIDHVSSWWKLRNERNVLLLTYEELRNDRRAAITKIAEFCEIDVADGRIDRAVERSSFEYMKSKNLKFDHMEGHAWVVRRRFKHGFIRQGEIGGGSALLSSAQKERFRDAYGKRLAELDLWPSDIQ